MTAISDAILTVPISEADAASGFRCGKRPLDDYFARYAVANDRTGVSKAFVLRRPIEETDGPQVLGFYTLSMALLESERAAEVVKAKLPRYPVPVALIGRFAVNEAAQGRGLGGTLLVDALRRVIGLSEQIGCLGVIVDAKDAHAERFYMKYGFTTLESTEGPRRMMLPMATIHATFTP
jgi:GNAT superfamily N-acetyltransferase